MLMKVSQRRRAADITQLGMFIKRAHIFFLMEDNDRTGSVPARLCSSAKSSETSVSMPAMGTGSRFLYRLTVILRQKRDV